jgi:hypothetical protein
MNSLYEAPRFPSSNAMHAEDTSVLLARLDALSLKQEQLEQRNAELEAIVAGKPPGGSYNRGGLGARGSILQQKRKATRRLGGAQTSDDAQPSDDDALDNARSDDPEENSEERPVGTYDLGGKVSEMHPTVRAARSALQVSGQALKYSSAC